MGRCQPQLVAGACSAAGARRSLLAFPSLPLLALMSSGRIGGARASSVLASAEKLIQDLDGDGTGSGLDPSSGSSPAGGRPKPRAVKIEREKGQSWGIQIANQNTTGREGPYVDSLDEGSPAEAQGPAQGLVPRCRIASIDGKLVKDFRDCVAILQNKKLTQVTLVVIPPRPRRRRQDRKAAAAAAGGGGAVDDEGGGNEDAAAAALLKGILDDDSGKGGKGGRGGKQQEDEPVPSGPTPMESFRAGMKLVNEAVAMDHGGDASGAFRAYCEAVDALAAGVAGHGVPEASLGQAVQNAVAYLDRAEQIQLAVGPRGLLAGAKAGGEAGGAGGAGKGSAANLPSWPGDRRAALEAFSKERAGARFGISLVARGVGLKKKAVEAQGRSEQWAALALYLAGLDALVAALTVQQDGGGGGGGGKGVAVLQKAVGSMLDSAEKIKAELVAAATGGPEPFRVSPGFEPDSPPGPPSPTALGAAAMLPAMPLPPTSIAGGAAAGGGGGGGSGGGGSAEQSAIAAALAIPAAPVAAALAIPEAPKPQVTVELDETKGGGDAGGGGGGGAPSRGAADDGLADLKAYLKVVVTLYKFSHCSKCCNINITLYNNLRFACNNFVVVANNFYNL